MTGSISILALCLGVATLAQTQPSISLTGPNNPLYSSPNLEGHSLAAECNPGGDSSCPCSISDVQLLSRTGYGEVISNPRRVNTWVNAIGHKKFLEKFSTGPMTLNTYRYRAEVRLPAIPKPSVAQATNAEAVHLMIQFWDGRSALWNANKRTLEGAVYWNLNPWTPDFGAVKLYTYPLNLVATGFTLAPDTNWHQFELVVDLGSKKYSSLVVDGRSLNVSQLPLAEVYHPDWGSEIALNITTESMASWPGPTCANIFTWPTQFRNIQFHKVNPELSWAGSAGKRYVLQTSPDLRNWNEQLVFLPSSGSIPLGLQDDLQFFRLREAF